MLTIAQVQRLGGYGVVNADPAWSYNDLGCNGAVPYAVMSPKDIKALPVKEITSPDCALFLWGTYPKLPEVLEVGEAWGFKFKSIAFQWIKYRGRMEVSPAELRRQAAELLEIAAKIEQGILSGREDWLKLVPFLGLGRWTRGNTEPCLLFTKGKPKRVDKAVSQLIETFDGEEIIQDGILQAPLGRHSAKPRLVRERIKILMGHDIPAIELYARDRMDGYDAWGDDPALGGADVALTGREYIFNQAPTENYDELKAQAESNHAIIVQDEARRRDASDRSPEPRARVRVRTFAGGGAF